MWVFPPSWASQKCGFSYTGVVIVVGSKLILSQQVSLSSSLVRLFGFAMSKRSTTTNIFFASFASLGLVGALYYYWQVENEKRLLTNNHIEVRTTATVKERAVPRRSLKVKKDYTVEICLSDLQSVREALSGGCGSIELCSNRIEGGKIAVSAHFLRLYPRHTIR